MDGAPKIVVDNGAARDYFCRRFSHAPQAAASPTAPARTPFDYLSTE
jgi:hypothetical protein